MTPMLRIAATAAALILGVAGPPPGAARAGTVPKFCYLAANDTDGDGFAATGEGKTLEVDEHKKLYCPEEYQGVAYVSEKGDCDDTRSTIHPYAPEVAFNGVDEDCDDPDEADEPELVYFKNGNQNTQTSFAIRVRLRDAYLVGFGASLAYEVEFYDLAATSPTFKRKTPTRTVGALSSDYAFDAVVTGLQPARVYKAQLRFYRVVTSTVIERGVRTRRTTFEDIHRSSPEYYTTTAGSGILEDARTDAAAPGVLPALGVRPRSHRLPEPRHREARRHAVRRGGEGALVLGVLHLAHRPALLPDRHLHEHRRHHVVVHLERELLPR